MLHWDGFLRNTLREQGQRKTSQGFSQAPISGDSSPPNTAEYTPFDPVLHPVLHCRYPLHGFQ